MTWEIAVGIFALVTFAITIGTLAFKLAGILSKLESAVDNLRETITTIKDNNNNEHERIFEMLEKFSERLTAVETELILTNRNPRQTVK